MHTKHRRRSAKVLSLAIGGAVGYGLFDPALFAATRSWTYTGPNPATWTDNTNWLGGAPGSSDLALFLSPKTPPSNTVNLNSTITIGAIVDNILPTTNLTITGTANVTLDGQTVTVPESAGFGSLNFTQSNTVISNTSTLSTSKNLTLDTNLHVFLNQAQNYIITSPGTGANAGTKVTINGTISDGPSGSASLIFLGGGNPSYSGGTLVLNGNNNFTGGLTIGTPDGTQGGAVSVSAASNLPSSGSIVVNDQGQLALATAGTYGVSGQVLYLNGIGENKNSSGALRTGGNPTDLFYWNGDVNIGTSSIADGNDGFVVISITSQATKKLQINGKFTGTGKLQKQGQGDLVFAGTNNDNAGDTQIGNGVIDVLAGSQMGTGNLDLFQTSSNTTTVNLFNANQIINSLSSHFTATSGGDSTHDTQVLNIGTPGLSADGQILTIRQHSDQSFGFGATVTLNSFIQGPGGIVMDATSDHTLTLTGSNSYVGGTTLNGGTLDLANGTLGSAVGMGSVTVNSGGHLSSGNAIVIGSPVASGKMTGTLIAAIGGIIAPGAAGTTGSLTVGTLQAQNGSIFDFDLQGATHSRFDQLIAAGSVTLSPGTETVNVLGSQLAAGTYQLINFQTGSLSSGASFTLGSTPGGANRTYSLTTSSTGVLLTITNTGTDRNWSVGGGTPTNATDGSGVWQEGSQNFFQLPNSPSAGYVSSSNSDVVIGSTGSGGQITLGSPVRVGGNLILDNVTAPYTIGAAGGTNTLTLAKGFYGAASATINAPIKLENSQTFSVGLGATVTIAGPITDSGSGFSMTKGDVGTLVLNGTASYTGGTTINGGALQVTTATLPAAGGVTNNALLVFSQGTSGSYGGLISGTGSVVLNNSASASTTLSNGSNSYTGATVIQGGVLSVGSVGQLGTGDGGIVLSGGTFQATSPLNFPKNSGSPPDRTITLTPSTISTIDTGANTVTFNQNIGGAGGFTKIGSGSLILTGLPSTTILGTISILGGSVVLAPPAAVPSFGWSAPSSANAYTGDIVISQPMELRLFGGTFGGGGALRVNISGTQIDSRATVGTSLPNTVFNNNIILNGAGSPGFSVDLNAQAGSTFTINGQISGNSDVGFSGGAGTVQLGGVSNYTGNTTIDNGTGGEVVLLINGALPATSDVHITSTGTFDLNGFNQTIGSLDGGSDTASVYNNTTAANKPSTLTIIGSASTQFQGLLSDGNFNKLTLALGTGNTGTLYLSGSNLYTGGNILNGGTLIVDQDLALGQDPLSGATTSTLTFGGGALDITTSFDTTDRPLIVNAGNSTISVTSGQTFGLLGNAVTTWNGGSLTVAGGGTMNINRSSGTVSVTNGSTFGVGTSSTATINASTVDPFTDSAVNTRHVAIVNNGTVAITSGNTVIARETGSGTLIISNGASVKLAQNSSSVTSRVGTLSIATISNSKLDITNNALIIDNTSLATVQGLLKNGYNSGAWNGPGIFSSTAAASTSPKTSVGSAQASDLGVISFGGMAVNPTSVLVKYTYAADANLDGKVDVSDMALLAQHWNMHNQGWSGGDFNYDGVTDVADLYIAAKNWQVGVGSPLGPSLAPILTALGLPQVPVAVPEPSCLGILLGGALLARRTRKRGTSSK